MGKGKEIIKKVKYISISLYRSIKHDLFSSWNGLDKPKEVMSILTYVFIIQLFLRHYTFVGLTIILYVAAYIWKVYRKGEWRHLMRSDYKKDIRTLR